MDSEKSPIAKLNEIMYLKRKVIDYELVSMTGHVHNPVFTFRIKSDELVGKLTYLTFSNDAYILYLLFIQSKICWNYKKSFKSSFKVLLLL